MSDLVGTPEDRFSCVAAHIILDDCNISLFDTIILRGKSLVSNFDLPDYYNVQSLALDVPLY